MSVKQLLQSVRRATTEDLEQSSLAGVGKIGSELTANMRALRLVATLCDQLLSRGMAASDVVYYGLGITSTYCARKVHIDISHNILTISQDRGIDREPLTLVRTVPPRSSDYFAIQALEDLARQIRAGAVPLTTAEHRLDAILARKPLYPNWLVHLAGGGISAGVVMLYSPQPLMWLVALGMGTLVSLVVAWLARRGVPAFYSQAAAGLIVILVAAFTSLLAAHVGIAAINSTLIIIGGIVMLVAGMMIVSALQDALDEYYVTAMARLLKVMMMTGGIVVGVIIGLYIATKLGVQLSPTPERLSLAGLNYQYLGAAVLAGSFALGNRARWQGVLAAGLVGFLSLYTTLVAINLGVGAIPASGLAAIMVGFVASVASRLLRIPSLVIMSAGIIPLVPGLTLYSALVHIAPATPGTAEFDHGTALLLRALLIAVVIAAGVTFGNLIGRPARARIIQLNNALPHWRLGKR